MIAVVLPLPLALASTLALTSDGAEPAADLHVTLAVIDSDHPDVAAKVAKLVANVAMYSTAVPATITGVGRFSGHGSDALDAFHLLVDAPSLASLAAGVRDEMRWAGLPVKQEHGFIPHVTLAYIAKDAPAPLERIDLTHTRFDAISVWSGAERTNYQLSALLSAARSSVIRLDARALSGIPTELCLFKEGWNDTVHGQFLLDAEAAQKCLAAFADHGVELAMDFDHGTYSADGKKRDVPGYIGALEYRAGVGLFATKIRWTQVGLEAISPGKDDAGQPTLPEYRYFSPAIRFDGESKRITSIEPVALVTWPATKNQPPLVMSARGAVTDTEKSQMNPQLLMLLGLAASATENDTLAAVNKLKSEHKAALDAKASSDAMAEAIKADRDAKAKELVESKAALEAKTKEFDTLRANLEATERQALLDQGRREHKLTVATEKFFADKSPAEIKAYLAVAPVIPALDASPRPPSGRSNEQSAQLSAILQLPYEKWSNEQRVLVKQQAPEVFDEKRNDAIERRAL